MNNKNILNVKFFSCGYKNGFYIKDISFSLEEGNFLGIIGPNGSGKTTLFKGIYGDIPSVAGNVIFEDRDIHYMSFREKAQKLAIVSQFPQTADLTAEEYVLMGRLPYRKQFQFFDKSEDIQIAHHYMNLTNTYRFKDKSILELSGGEQQMVSIASALSQKPRLLLLDEPTSHLDITHQIKFMNLIQELNENLNLSVIMIIHDINLASEYCNYLLMMKNGRLLFQGSPNEVITTSNIEEIYETDVVVSSNHASGKPIVLPISQKRINQIKQ